ncbi:MAG: hydantoinase B/oxoprolinase family protein [Deltaproteobacteria bacterium]|nr:hydantoinase B/oxoprolinase family protein [Deltaproteobacteria bacterium]
MKDLFGSVAEEMGTTLERTGLSPNIKERRDFSCAVFDGAARLIAQAAHIPVHLGSMASAVESAVAQLSLAPGDEVLVNDPFAGGTHLPDLTLVTPVFLDGARAPRFFVASRAHHADVGGMSPGSMPLARSIYQEGLRIPPVRIARVGALDREVLGLVLANMRVPEERLGDLAAQRGANAVGANRLGALAARFGARALATATDELLDYSERLVRALVREIPPGRHRFADALDDDGLGHGPIPIAVEVRREGRRGADVVFDFTGSSPQVEGPVNAVRAVTLSAVFYALRTLLSLDVPTNAGILRPVRLITPPASVVDAAPPAAVSAGNVETSQRLVDVVLGALARALPGRVPAASAGTMNNLAVGGGTGIAAFAYYETIAGGMGGRPGLDGLSAVQTHMTNTRNTPIEALEHAYPLRITRYQVRRGSGGAGAARGGDGVIREMEVLAPLTATVVSERRASAPYGLAGGAPGARGRNVRIDVAGAEHELPAKVTLALEAGERLRIETPGGGGYGVERAATGDGTPVATTAFVARGAPSPRAKRVRSRS